MQKNKRNINHHPYPSDTLYLNEKLNYLTSVCGKNFGRLSTANNLLCVAGIFIGYQLYKLEKRVEKLEAVKQED